MRNKRTWSFRTSRARRRFPGTVPPGRHTGFLVIPHCQCTASETSLDTTHIVRLYYCGKARLFFHLCADVHYYVIAVHNVSRVAIQTRTAVSHIIHVLCAAVTMNTCSEGPPGGNTCSDYLPPTTGPTLWTGVSVTALNATVPAVSSRIRTANAIANVRKTRKKISSSSKVTCRRFVCLS